MRWTMRQELERQAYWWRCLAENRVTTEPPWAPIRGAGCPPDGADPVKYGTHFGCVLSPVDCDCDCHGGIADEDRAAAADIADRLDRALRERIDPLQVRMDTGIRELEKWANEEGKR